MQRIRSGSLFTVLVTVLCAAGGFALGQRQGWNRARQVLEAEVAGGLSLRVETASRLRVGSVGGALELLDGAIDQTVWSAARQQDLIHERWQVALAQAKLYREVVPSMSAEAEEIRGFLDKVSVPDDKVFVCIRPGGKVDKASGLAQLMKR